MHTANTLMRCVVTSALVAACGSDSDTTTEPPPIATDDDVAAYAELVLEVDLAVRDYEATMADRTVDCLDAHEQYDQLVRPVIARMLGAAAPLDDFIGTQLGNPDLECGARALMDELDDHDHVACMWPTAERDREEAARHVGIMLLYTTHATERCDEMRTGMTGGDWQWHPMQCAY